MRCRFLQKADEAVEIGPRGERPIDLAICEWPDQHPERFVNAPRWITRQIGPGLAITPEHDCPGCPGFAAED